MIYIVTTPYKFADPSGNPNLAIPLTYSQMCIQSTFLCFYTNVSVKVRYAPSKDETDPFLLIINGWYPLISQKSPVNRREALRKVSLTGGLLYSKHVPRPIL